MGRKIKFLHKVLLYRVRRGYFEVPKPSKLSFLYIIGLGQICQQAKHERLSDSVRITQPLKTTLNRL